MRKLSDEQIIAIAKKGGGGTSNYNDLTNKPSIEGTTLQGRMTASGLNLASKDYADLINEHVTDLESVTNSLESEIYETNQNLNNLMWTGTQAQYEALTPAEKMYDYYNIIEDEEESANTASLQSLSPLTLDRNTLNTGFDTMDYPEEEVSEDDTER